MSKKRINEDLWSGIILGLLIGLFIGFIGTDLLKTNFYENHYDFWRKESKEWQNTCEKSVVYIQQLQKWMLWQDGKIAEKEKRSYKIGIEQPKEKRKSQK